MTPTESSPAVATPRGEDVGTAPDGPDGDADTRVDDTATGTADAGTTSIDPADLEALPGTGRGSDDALDIGEVFELLKNERRRRVIRFLQAQPDGTATLDVLAEHIAALENDVEVAQLSSRQRKRVYIGLYQCHLPKLDDYGVVEFRKNRGIIHLQDVSVLERYLPDPDPHGDGHLPADPVDGPDSTAGDTDTGPDTVTNARGAAPGLAVRSPRKFGSAVVVAALVLVGTAGVGPLALLPASVWTVICIAALLWSAAT